MKIFKLDVVSKYFLYTLLALVFTSCYSKVHQQKQVTNDFKQQNIDVVGGWQYQIINYKGHEYICNSSRGGIIHSESCECKN